MFRFVFLAVLTLPPAFGDQTQCVGGPCGPAHQLCGPAFTDAPAFHLMDATCAENDPNGPFFDPVHGLYHYFYQDHLAIPPGHGPDWGHAVSYDFVHWAHLPVAIWNDQPYDREAIFTGSTTIVDGKPVIIYPGLCDTQSQEFPNCKTGTLFAVAVPSNASDPLYINWSKPSYNPIVNNTQRDPSTAWQTPDGEWRIISYGSVIYGSMDFINWYEIGANPTMPVGECPSFFPLPDLYPNTVAEGAIPNFVIKSSHGGKDWMGLGTYVPGKPKQLGQWNATPGVDFEQVLIDVGDFYASKDFNDTKHNRRINFGWARVPPASTQTLPRHLRYHPTLKQLIHSPVAEQEQLRGHHLVAITNAFTLQNTSSYLGNWSNSAGKQAEIIVRFAKPASQVVFGIDVTTADRPGANGTRISIDNYNSSAWVVGVGDNTKGMLTQYMPDTDLPGGDFNVTNVNYTDPHICQQVCFNNPDCFAYTYVVRPPLHAACCQKGATGWSFNPGKSTCTSGVRSPRPIIGGKSAELTMLATDSEVELRVFIDHTFIEAYWQDGRVAMTATLEGQEPEAGIRIFAEDGEVTVNSVDVWHVNSIWISPEQVLEQLRNGTASR